MGNLLRELEPWIPGESRSGRGWGTRGRETVIIGFCDQVQQFTCLFNGRLLLYMTMSRDCQTNDGLVQRKIRLPAAGESGEMARETQRDMEIIPNKKAF